MSINIVINFLEMFNQSFIKSNYLKNIHPETPEEINIQDIENEDVIKRFKELGTSEYDLGSNVTLVVIVKNPYYYQPTDIALSVSDGTVTQPLFLSVNPEATAMTTVIYEITENDIINGEITLTLDVEVNGQTFNADYTIDTIVEPNVDVIVTTTETSSPQNGEYYLLAESQEYLFTVTNTGNLTIDYEFDDGLGSVNYGTLTPSESDNYSDSSSITEDIILNGTLTFTPRITCEAYGEEYSFDIDEFELTNIEEENNAMNVTYDVQPPSNGETYQLNEEIIFTYTITNIGNITGNNIQKSSYFDDEFIEDGTIASLAPGQSQQYTVDSCYISSTDITNGYFELKWHLEWINGHNETEENEYSVEIPISDE